VKRDQESRFGRNELNIQIPIGDSLSTFTHKPPLPGNDVVGLVFLVIPDKRNKVKRDQESRFGRIELNIQIPIGDSLSACTHKPPLPRNVVVGLVFLVIPDKRNKVKRDQESRFGRNELNIHIPI
jgi:chemotaxis receptor (MCP) glutamine deamidase CheD